MRMLLEPQRHEISDNYSVRRCKILRFDGDIMRNETEIWFHLDPYIPLPPEEDCDAYLIGVVMEVMRENRQIEVMGTVSKQLLSNLVELQTAWKRWKPNIYNSIDIFANSERNTAKRPHEQSVLSQGELTQHFRYGDMASQELATGRKTSIFVPLCMVLIFHFQRRLHLKAQDEPLRALSPI